MRNLDHEQKSPCCPGETLTPWQYEPGSVYCPDCGTVNPVVPSARRTPARWLKFRTRYAARTVRLAWWRVLNQWETR